MSDPAVVAVPDDPLADHLREATRHGRRGLGILLLGLLPIAAWLALAPLTSAVVAHAVVKVDLNRRPVQHQEGGIVREIRVRDGDRVKQGQPLVVLEDVRVDSTLDLLSTQLVAERAKAARLAAEAAYAPKVAFPADIQRREDELKVVEILERERALFRSRRDSVDSTGCTRMSCSTLWSTIA